MPYVVVDDGSQAELAVLRGAEGPLVDPGAVDGCGTPASSLGGLPAGRAASGCPAHEHAEGVRMMRS